LTALRIDDALSRPRVQNDRIGRRRPQAGIGKMHDPLQNAWVCTENRRRVMTESFGR
jgi:hypothetical protein